MAPVTSADPVGDGVERAILELESTRRLVADADPRSGPLDWIIDRLTEMSVIGEDLHPDWYYFYESHPMAPSTGRPPDVPPGMSPEDMAWLDQPED